MAERGKIWELLGRSVKWEEVVRHAPKIVEAARVQTLLWLGGGALAVGLLALVR